MQQDPRPRAYNRVFTVEITLYPPQQDHWSVSPIPEPIVFEAILLQDHRQPYTCKVDGLSCDHWPVVMHRAGKKMQTPVPTFGADTNGHKDDVLRLLQQQLEQHERIVPAPVTGLRRTHIEDAAKEALLHSMRLD